MNLPGSSNGQPMPARGVTWEIVDGRLRLTDGDETADLTAAMVRVLLHDCRAIEAARRFVRITVKG